MYLIFDTETTGLPKNWKAPITDSNNWPRCVQLAWQLHDEMGTLIEVKNFIIKPEDYTIPYNAEKVHGISTDRANKQGVDLSFVLEEFNNAIQQSKYAVGHNIGFDIKIVGAEFYRKSMSSELTKLPMVNSCTETTATLCQIPGGRGGKYKLPKLAELHIKLFNVGFDEAHNAAADVEATARCVLELIRIGVITGKDLKQNEQYIKSFNEFNPKPFELIGLNTQPYSKLELEKEPILPIDIEDITDEQETIVSDMEAFNFSHLHCHTQHSVLQSTAKISGLLQKAVEYDMNALAITDLGNLYGVFKFVKEADRKSTRLNSSHTDISRMPSSA